MKATIEVSEEDIKDFLKNLGERELLSLLIDVLSNRNPDLEGTWETRLCVEELDKLYLVADGGTVWVEDAKLCQFGECCYPLVSWAKDAICPICGRKVYLS